MKFTKGNYFIDSSGDKHYTHIEIIQGIKELELELDIEKKARKIDADLAQQQIKELKGYIENALRIKDLWLIEDKNCPPENVGEARALANMEAEFLKALNQ